MFRYKRILILLSLLGASFCANAASIPFEWNVVAGPITSDISTGGNVATTEARLYDGTNTEIGVGSIDDFTLAIGSNISGSFTGAAGIYSILGQITSIDFSGTAGAFTFSGFSANSDIATGSLSQTSGSSSLDLAGSTLTFVPVPAAVWLFGSGLIGLVAVARRRSITA